MARLRPVYSVLVLFGKETKRSVRSGDSFAHLTDSIARLLELAGCKVKARGTIHGPKWKNIAPPRRLWTPQHRDKYIESLKVGDLLGIELFDGRWSNAREPDAFGSIHKFWNYGPGHPERCEIGAENSVTIALREDLVPGSFVLLKCASRELLEQIDGFHGIIESGVPWAQPIGEMYEDMIDIRWHNRGNNDFCNGEYRMGRMAARLARGNILCRTQFTHYDPQGLRKQRGVTAVEAWPQRLTYVELDKQPRYGSKPPSRFAKFIRFVPEETFE